MRKYPPLGFRGVVRPNYDTLYSIAWLNLENGPVVVTAPDMGDRFYIFETLDYWSDNFASPGWRTTGEGEKHFMYTPPGWSGKVPKNVVHIKSPTQRAWILGRTKTAGKVNLRQLINCKIRCMLILLKIFKWKAYFSSETKPPN